MGQKRQQEESKCVAVDVDVNTKVDMEVGEGVTVDEKRRCKGKVGADIVDLTGIPVLCDRVCVGICRTPSSVAFPALPRASHSTPP
jgi:hypothetical protein